MKSDVNLKVIQEMKELLSVASDATRLKIMFSLLDDEKCQNGCGCHHCQNCDAHPCMIEKCVSEIVEDTNASQSLVSHQLKVLKDADLVSTRRKGTKIYYSLKDNHVKQLLTIVEEHVKEKNDYGQKDL